MKLGLVLYGGTAIALRLGHRASADFDFFTDKPLDKEALRAALPFIGGATVLQDQADTLTVLVAESEARAEIVKLSFFGGSVSDVSENPKQRTTVSCGWHRWLI
ncbi:MAG: nucleotidyl transferase AbiEii/AbiGii toxin family protein [Gammaproteobacteria bacterium]